MAADQWFSQGPGISSIRCNKSVNPFQRSSLGTLHKERFTVQMDGTQHCLHKEKGRNRFASQTKSKTRPNLNKEITWGNAMKSPQVIPALSGPGLCTDSSVAVFSLHNRSPKWDAKTGQCSQLLSPDLKKADKFVSLKISADFKNASNLDLTQPNFLASFLQTFSQRIRKERADRTLRRWSPMRHPWQSSG